MAADKQPVARTVVVTGASTGIGEACALRLDARGWRVFAGVRREQDGQALRRKASERLTPLMLDISDATSIAAAAEKVTATVGAAGLSGLVNNAGIAVAAPLEFLPIRELRRQLEVNIIGQVAVTQAFLPHIRQGRGRIVNIGSISGRIAAPFLGAYAASKFAMEALTDALRVELRPWGLHVALVEPGGIATPIWERSIAVADEITKLLPQQAIEYYGAAIPMVRASAARTAKTGTPPVEVAQAIEHALSSSRPKTRYLVGRGVRFRAAIIARLPDRLRDALIARRLPKYP
jgi:NAD(P)-dependent dehydrogenase (short-subunit alcohol dehydrogenase family)